MNVSMMKIAATTAVRIMKMVLANDRNDANVTSTAHLRRPRALIEYGEPGRFWKAWYCGPGAAKRNPGRSGASESTLARIERSKIRDRLPAWLTSRAARVRVLYASANS
jgi:hypothetical protein